MTDEQKKKKDEQEAQVPPVPTPSTAEMERTHADELAALQQAQADELGSLQQVNEQRFKDIGDIVAEAEAKLGTMKVDDETAQKRSEAFRYIAGLGDTLSGLANVVGTSFGAQNQQQTYNGGYVAEKAEQARKERKLEMDKISSRLDEMRAREKDLRTAGSLAEAELKAKQNRELAAEKNRLAAIAREDAYRDKQQAWREEEAARAQANADRNFEEGKRQFNVNQRRMADAAAAENASKQEIKKMELAAKEKERAAKQANDPKYQAQTLQQNITGIRDEIARKAGYDSYNEYLQYRNNKKVEGMSRRQTRKVREQNAYHNPEALELLNLLGSPENLDESQIRMLMSASSVFAEAVNKGTVTNDATAGGEEEIKFDDQGREIVNW